MVKSTIPARWLILFVATLTLGLVACGGPPNFGFGVAATLSFDSTVSDDALAKIVQLQVSGSGDETFEQTIPLGRRVLRSEHFVYRPEAGTRRLTLGVVARDANGDAVAGGRSAELGLRANETTEVEIRLAASDLVDAGTDSALAVDGGVDAASADAAVFQCPIDAICENFEGALGSGWTKAASGLVTNNIDGSKAHGGASAMHLHFPAQSSSTASDVGGMNQTDHQWLYGKNGYWLRTYLYFASPAPAHYFHLFQTARDTDSKDIEVSKASDQTFQMTTELNSTQSANSSSLLPTDRWLCIEWQVTIATSGSSSLYLDNNPLSLQLSENTVVTPPLGYVAITLGRYSANAVDPVAHDVWIDDVVLSVARLGCQF